MRPRRVEPRRAGTVFGLAVNRKLQTGLRSPVAHQKFLPLCIRERCIEARLAGLKESVRSLAGRRFAQHAARTSESAKRCPHRPREHPEHPDGHCDELYTRVYTVSPARLGPSCSLAMDGAAPDDNIDALPLEQRLTHKVRTVQRRNIAAAVLTTGVSPARRSGRRACPPTPRSRRSRRKPPTTRIRSSASTTSRTARPCGNGCAMRTLSPRRRESRRRARSSSTAAGQRRGKSASTPRWAALVFADGHAVSRSRSDVLPSVVEKCLGSARVRIPLHPSMGTSD